MFEIMTEIVTHYGIEAAREFALCVNQHIEELTKWQELMDLANGPHAIPEPARTNCDSEAAFLSAQRCWKDAQAFAHFRYPAPSAPMIIEQAIEVHTTATGARSYFYSDDRGRSVFNDALIRQSREVA